MPHVRPLDVDTGQQAIAGGMSKLGEALFDWGSKLKDVQDANAVSSTERAMHENWITEYNSLWDIQDSNARMELHQKSITDRQSLVDSIPSNAARMEAQRSLNRFAPQADMDFWNLHRGLIEQREKKVFKTNYAKFIEIGNYEGALSALDRAYPLLLAKEEYEQEKKDLPANITLSKGRRLAYTNPEEAMSYIDSLDKKDFTADQLEGMSNIRKTAETQREIMVSLDFEEGEKNKDDLYKKINENPLKLSDTDFAQGINLNEDNGKMLKQYHNEITRPKAVTDNNKYWNTCDTIMNYLTEQLDTKTKKPLNKEMVVRELRKARFDSRDISKDDYSLISKLIDNPPPLHISTALQARQADYKSRLRSRPAFYGEEFEHPSIMTKKEFDGKMALFNRTMYGWLTSQDMKKITPFDVARQSIIVSGNLEGTSIAETTPIITTEAEYDKLNIGDVYYDENSLLKRKT